MALTFRRTVGLAAAVPRNVTRIMSEEPKLDSEGPSRLRESALIENHIITQVGNRDERIDVGESGSALE